jgi:hypothetical protein
VVDCCSLVWLWFCSMESVMSKIYEVHSGLMRNAVCQNEESRLNCNAWRIINGGT